jgi:hypothetical protein
VFLSSILVFFLLFVFFSYFLYSTCPKALTQTQALVSGKKKIYIVSWYIPFTIPETSACDCVKAFGHVVLYEIYSRN